MRRLLMVVVVLLMVNSGFAQGGPELDALLDAFFAKDIKSLQAHLPPELDDVIAKLSADAQQNLATHFLLAEEARRHGVNITRPENGAVLTADQAGRGGDDSPAEHSEIYLDKYISGGAESMLRFRIKRGDYPPNEQIVVWMRYVEGDWRIYELDAFDREIRLDDPGFLADLARGPLLANEASAIGNLRTINTAAVTYSASFPDAGFPESLQVLGPYVDGSEPTEDHAGLIDNVLSSPPHEKSGYRFAYTKVSTGEYEAVGRPVKYESSGERSFYTDQSGVIRYTTEDRDATVDDPPLQ